MMRYTILLTFIILLVTQCRDKNGILIPPEQSGEWSANLIGNGSFEANGRATLDGWICDPGVPCQLVKDAAPQGGEWSLQLAQQSLSFQFRAFRYPVNVFPGWHVFRLTFWAKYNLKSGFAGFFAMRSDSIFHTKIIRVTSDDWRQYDLTDSVRLNYGDSLFVVLSGGVAEAIYIDAYTRFDRVELYEHYPSIIAAWKWIRSVGGFAGQVITPESVGYSLQYNFQSDSVLTIAKNGHLQSQTRFRVKEEPAWGEGRARVLYLDNDPIRRFISFTAPDTLILTDDCADCYTSTYVRVGPQAEKNTR